MARAAKPPPHAPRTIGPVVQDEHVTSVPRPRNATSPRCAAGCPAAECSRRRANQGTAVATAFDRSGSRERARRDRPTPTRDTAMPFGRDRVEAPSGVRCARSARLRSNHLLWPDAPIAETERAVLSISKQPSSGRPFAAPSSRRGRAVDGLFGGALLGYRLERPGGSRKVEPMRSRTPASPQPCRLGCALGGTSLVARPPVFLVKRPSRPNSRRRRVPRCRSVPLGNPTVCVQRPDHSFDVRRDPLRVLSQERDGTATTSRSLAAMGPAAVAEAA